MFWNKEKEIVYTDVLDEWRKVKIWDFNLFDRVTIWDSKKIYVLIWNERESFYKSSYYEWHKKIKSWNPNELRWGILENIWESYEKISYDSYVLLDKNWKTTTSYEVKKYYWEFQKEFESLNKAIKDEEQLKVKIEEIKKLEKSINENYNIARKIQNKNYKDLGIL